MPGGRKRARESERCLGVPAEAEDATIAIVVLSRNGWRMVQRMNRKIARR
jgi:hypothetical protein